MNMFSQILLLVLAGFSVFFLYRLVKNKPQLFTWEKFSQSLTTLGVLALILIVFVFFLVQMVRQ